MNNPNNTQNNIGPAIGNTFRDGNGNMQIGQPGVGPNLAWTDGRGNLQFGPPSSMWSSQR